jgi:hypothetical protein
MTEDEILNTLDNSNDGYYYSFVEFGHVYSYLIDSRLNVFVSDSNHWVIAIERLGYNPRADTITLDIHYYGNCLINLEYYNERPTSSYSIYPINNDNFDDTIDGECLKPAATFWLVRGNQLPLSHNKQDYADANIVLKEYEPNEISVEEAGRLVVSQNSKFFRATDSELYKSIPSDLKKILVLDEWFHKDFQLQILPTMTDEHLRQVYDLNKSMVGNEDMVIENLLESLKRQKILENDWNRKMWENNRPSSYETWQLIAKVIVTRDPSQYKPTLQSNTHWMNWQDSGSF